MALTIGNTSSTSSATNAASYSWAHNNNGHSVVAYAAVIDNAENTVEIGATYAGMQMEQVATVTARTSSRTYRTSIFLLNGATSGSNTLEVNANVAVTGFVGGAVTASHGGNGVAVGAASSQIAGGVIPLVTKVASSHIFTIASQRSNTTPPTFTNEADQTEVFDLSSGSATTEIAAVGLYRSTTSVGSYSVGATPSGDIGDIAVAAELYDATSASVATNLTMGTDTTDATSYTTASVSPTGNALLLLSLIARASDGGTPETPTITGNGLTWELASSHNTATNRKTFVFRSMGASPSSGTISIDFGGGNTMTSCSWSVDQITSVDTGGSNGSGAIVAATTGGGGSGTFVASSAFANINNYAFAAYSADDAAMRMIPEPRHTPKGFSQGGDNTLLTTFQQKNDPQIGLYTGASALTSLILLEIKAATQATTSTFGYTTAGGSTGTPGANTVHGSKFTLSEAGDVAQVNIYMRAHTTLAENANVRAGIYSDSGGWWDVLQGESETTIVGTSYAWHAFKFFTPISLSAGTYWIALNNETTVGVVYDAGSSNQGSTVTDNYYDGMASPQNQMTRTTNKYSLYALYTVASSTAVKDIIGSGFIPFAR